MIGRSELKEALLRYLEEERLSEIEDVLTGKPEYFYKYFCTFLCYCMFVSLYSCLHICPHVYMFARLNV